MFKQEVQGRFTDVIRGMVAALTVLTLVLRVTLIPTRLLLENDSPYHVALAAQIPRGDW